MDEDCCLKYCSVVSHNIKIIDYIENAYHQLTAIKFNQLRDRFIVRISETQVKEYVVSNSVISMVNEVTEKNGVADFCYFHRTAMKAEGVDIVTISDNGVLRRMSTSDGTSRRFAIDGSTRMLPQTAKTTKSSRRQC